MRHWRSILLATGLLCNGTSYGDADSKLAKNDKKQLRDQGERTYNGKRIVERDETVYRDSSEYWRQNKKYSLTIELLSLSPFGNNGYAAGYYLNPDTMIEASYTKHDPLLFFSDLTETIIEGRYKQWFGNSFYMNLGGAIHTISGGVEVDPFDIERDDVEVDIYAQSIAGVISIGNQWQWEYFTMGCDWVGVHIPLISGDVKVSNTSEADNDEVAETKERLDEDINTSSGTLLRFYLGVSF